MSLRIQLLGPPRLSLGGHPIDLPGYRPLALLAYLVTTGQPHSRSHLIDLLFEGPDDPRAALRWTLSKLRTAIGSDYILADRQEVSFNFQSDFWLDASAFEAGEFELFQGDFLEGLYLRNALRFEEWLLFERERLRGQYQAGLEQQLEMHERQDDAAAVVTTAHLLLKQDNLREDWQRALMKAYARLGKRDTALAQFEQCRQVLRAELDVDPSPETVALVEAIRSGQVGLDSSPVTSPASPQRRMPTSIGQSSQPISAPMPSDVENETVMARQIRPGLSPSWVFLRILGAVTLIVALAMVLSSFFDFNSRADVSNTAGSEAAAESTIAAGIARTDGDGTNGGQDSRGRDSSRPNHVDQPGPLAGTTVTIVGPGRDEQQKLFEQSMGPFEERTGINVVYIIAADQLKSFVKARVEQGYPPDIAAFPQPGLLAEFVRQGKIVDLRTFLSDDYLQQQYTDTFLELATVDGKMAGVWHDAFLKSLVWYPKQPFEARGYEVPETWDELMALSDRIVADGGIPWCIGIESGDNSGWVGTDWVEDILLRTAPPETYDAWARHDLPFNSPEIRRVFEIMGQIWLNDDYVYGGVANISTESWRDSAVHLFEDPPGCYLHRQASFVRYVFPQTARYGQDYDFFYLPPIDPEFGHPVLGGGDIFAMFNDRPEVREVMRYLTTAESARALVEGGGFLSPNRNTPLEWYPSAAELRFAEIILSADTYRFDGSDLMPREVGTGSFFRGITDWVEGADLEMVLQEIDNSWPQ